MTPTKLLIGQILIVFAIVIGAVWGATQWAAAALEFQPRLGPAWFEIAGYPAYLPWRACSNGGSARVASSRGMRICSSPKRWPKGKRWDR